MELRIAEPRLRRETDRVFLCTDVQVQGVVREAWFSVEPQYADYLTAERSDAFVVSFLTTAMRQKRNIVCRAPMTRRLYYQLTQYLIPLMAANFEEYHAISIEAPLTDTPLPCAGAVGTGWTRGVDCSFTLMEHLHAQEPSRRLTHLLITNNGAMESKDNADLLAFLAEKARREIAAEEHLQVIPIDSNIHLLQQENYLAIAAFRLPAVVLAVQKLFGVFLHSSGQKFSEFSFDPEDSCRYELLPLSCFETDCTVFYSTGGEVRRIDKLQALAEFPPARKYLHPCIYARRDNCGLCVKCMRTQGALDVLGVLENFSEVFDLARFRENKELFYRNLVTDYLNPHNREILEVMKERGEAIPAHIVREARIRRAAIMVAQKKWREERK